MLRHKIIKAKNKDLLCDLLWNLWLMSIDFVTNCCLPLREVVSWNFSPGYTYIQCICRLPLREVVSWNHGRSGVGTLQWSLPLREVVSWNSHFCQVPHSWQCLPLCEVVSWNLTFFREDTTSLRSTSAWGSELKYQMLPWHYRQDQSTSAWGSELKSRMTVRAQICIRLPLREVVSWNDDLIDQIIEEHVYLCVR